MTIYQIAFADDIVLLPAAVQAFLDAGYCVHGDPFVIPPTNQDRRQRYAQAVQKFEYHGYPEPSSSVRPV